MAESDLNEKEKISYKSDTAFGSKAFSSFVEIINSFVTTNGEEIHSTTINDTCISCDYNELISDGDIRSCITAIKKGSISKNTLEFSWGITFNGSRSAIQIAIKKVNFTTRRKEHILSTPKQHGGARNSVEKTEYSDITIKKYFDNEKVKNVEIALQNIWDSYNDGAWKTESLRLKIFSRLFTKFGGKELIECGEIVNSLKAFIDEIISRTGPTSSQKQRAINTIVAGARYASENLSNSSIADALGVSQKNPGFKAVPNNNDDHECDIEENNIMTREIVFDNVSSDDSSDNDSIDEEIGNDVDDDNDNNENIRGNNDELDNIQTPPPLKKRKSSREFANDILKNCEPQRAERKDAVDLSVADAWMHSACQYNTDTNKCYNVINHTSGKVELHRQRLRTDSMPVLYKDFIDSDSYSQHLSQNPGQTISKRLFDDSRCKCIKPDKLHKCADTVLVQFKQYFKSMQNIIRNSLKDYQECQCHKHQDGKLIAAILKSEGAFIGHILCDEVEHSELSRNKENLHTIEVHRREEEINVLAATTKIDAIQAEKGRPLRHTEKRALDVTHNKIDTDKAIQQGILKIHNRSCSHSKCHEQNCGVEKMLNCNICPLESRQNEVHYRRYETGSKITGSDKRFKNKVLEETSASHERFFADFYSFLITHYLPHAWEIKSDKFHRNLCFDDLADNVVALHTDFSGKYECVGQFEATCSQPRSANQDVFIVSHSDQKDNELRQKNLAYHIWGYNDAKDDPSADYKYHMTCLIHILNELQEKYPGRFTVLKVFTDGCQEQYKSMYTAEELTYLIERCPWLEVVIDTKAPTAGFKCCCDSNGNDTKADMRKDEISGKVRAKDAFQVFVHLDKNMPPPVENNTVTKQFQIHERYQLFLTSKEKKTAEMDAYGSKILTLLDNGGQRNGKHIDKIRKIHQFKVTKENMGTRKISFRNETCHCWKCKSSNYEQCVSGIKWIEMDLFKSIEGKNKSKKNVDEEGQRVFEYLSSAGPNNTIIVALLDNEEGEPLYAVVTGLAKKHTGKKVNSSIGETSHEIKAGTWEVPVDFLVPMNKRDLIYGYDAEHKSVIIPCSRIFVPITNVSQPNEFVQFLKSSKYKTGNITVQLEHFIIDSKSNEMVIDSL